MKPDAARSAQGHGQAGAGGRKIKVFVAEHRTRTKVLDPGEVAVVGSFILLARVIRNDAVRAVLRMQGQLADVRLSRAQQTAGDGCAISLICWQRGVVQAAAGDFGLSKGNLILISGGGNYLRGTEAQDVAPGFVELGYNCFVLHRRVAPYGADEIAMDLQRAIRYVKFHGEEMGLGGLDVIGAAGFSGGGGNVCTVIQKFYGDITPDQFDTDYVCDEIDAVNSDMQIAMPIYSARALETENPNVPHLFIAIGEADSMGFENSIAMFKWAYELGLHPELHIFGNVVHGFGPGTEGTSSTTWMEAADLYIQHNLLKKQKYETIPAEYTMKQTVLVTWFPKDVGDVPVDVYVNSDHSKFFLAFSSWGDTIQVEGILVGDSVAGVTFDSVGFFTEDAPKMWALADPNAWTPVE